MASANTKAIPVKATPLPQQVVRLIQEKIIRGEFLPGERIIEQTLAKEYQVARSVIREGLIELDQQGLVQRLAHKGTYVTKLSMEDYDKAMVVRVVLEYLSYLLAFARYEHPDFRTAETVLGEMNEAIGTADCLALKDYDVRFHKALWDLSGNPCLVEILRRLFVQFDQLTGRPQGLPGDSDSEFVAVHEELLQVLKRKDLGEVWTALRRHCEIWTTNDQIPWDLLMRAMTLR